MAQLTENEAAQAKDLLEKALYELKRVIVGQEHLLERLLIAVIAHGHVLVEGAPGLAKTLALKSLSEVVAVEFKRIQFTPDLLPSDLTGTKVYNPGRGEFFTELGPIFANFVLADEINRAPAKVQSALLEAMQERQVTLGRETYPLKAPFLVMATQNPIESEGTYTLPEAQLDRFLFKLPVTYPDAREETVIIQRMTGESLPTLKPVLAGKDLIRLGQWATLVYVDPKIVNYAVDLVQATRIPPDAELKKFIRYGASPRGSLALIHGAKAMALVRGRHYIIPEDVTTLVHDCLRHRILLTYEALAAGCSPDQILDRILAKVPAPQLTGV